MSGDALSYALLESAPDAIVITNADGQIVIVNSQAEHVFGYPRNEMLGQPIELLLPEHLRAMHERHREVYGAAPHTRPMGLGLDLTARRKDGTVFPVEISLSALQTEAGLLITSVVRDMTERQRVEAALRASEDRFARVFRASPVAMGLIRLTDTRIMDVNASFLHHLGYERNEVIDRSVDDLHLFVDSTAYARVVQLLHERPSLHDLETAFRTKAGTTRDVLAALERVDVGGDACMLLLYQDITELAQQLAHAEAQQQILAQRLSSTEAGMLQAARLAAVGQLAASVAHEINNPLYAARNSLYLLTEDLPEELRKLPFLAIARDELARIAGIVERMRDFYRPDRGEVTPCDINHLLQETVVVAGLNTRHAAIDVVFTPAPLVPKVFGNSDQLRQVFLNLMLNAIEAMPDGGTLTVRTKPGPTVVLIEIQDTGIGIPPDIRPRLFEPFFTNKSNGTGLGLSISAHIVTQHGGQIDVESAPGQGSMFRVVLPYKPHA